MSPFKVSTFGVLVLSFALGTLSRSQAQTVVHHPSTDAPLEQRWEWASRQPKERGWTTSYWVGYSIRRWMAENSYIGRVRTSPGMDRPSLRDLISPQEEATVSEPTEEALRRAAREALLELQDPRRRERKVLKEVAILFLFSPESEVEDVRISNLALSVDLQDHPLVWLGSAEDKASVALLRRLYPTVSDPERREEMVAAVAMHDSDELVVPFLRQILLSKEDDEVRQKAAFWLGQGKSWDALELLVNAARSDRSTEVREQAVFAISQMRMEAATDALIRLARDAPSLGVRRKAIFWLAQLRHLSELSSVFTAKIPSSLHYIL